MFSATLFNCIRGVCHLMNTQAIYKLLKYSAILLAFISLFFEEDLGGSAFPRKTAR